MFDTFTRPAADRAQAAAHQADRQDEKQAGKFAGILPEQSLTDGWPPLRMVIPGTCRESSSFASFFSKISDVFHVLFDPLANHVEGLFLRLGAYLR